MLRPCLIATALLAIPAAAVGNEKPVPEGLNCPAEAGGAELISTAVASSDPGVSGLCVYYVYDEEDSGRNVTLTLRVGTADYDPNRSFKDPKVERGGMAVTEEATRTMGFGGRSAPATVISLTGKEADLGDITDVFNTLHVFRLDGGRVVALEVEYTNLSADLHQAPRDALLAVQN